MKQHTLSKSFVLEGKGLHTGLQIKAEFLPADENTGIRFCRTDLPGEPIVEALASNVAATERGTVVKKGEAVVSTIEHTLAALSAHGVDNCLIKVNAPEVPILDGSAILICNKINEVGVIEQNAEKRVLNIVKPQKFVFPNGSEIDLIPDSKFSIAATVDFSSPILKKQTALLESLDDFDTEVASARTFVFVREIEPLLQHNLIKGGDLDNAIVIYDQQMPRESIDKLASLLGIEKIHIDNLGYLNSRPLKWDNEPARHKLLDIIGDLALVGAAIHAKVVAYKPGHAINTQVAKALLETI